MKKTLLIALGLMAAGCADQIADISEHHRKALDCFIWGDYCSSGQVVVMTDHEDEPVVEAGERDFVINCREGKATLTLLLDGQVIELRLRGRDRKRLCDGQDN